MRDLQARPITNAWVMADWDDYVRILDDPSYEKAKGYYYKGHMRLEVLPVSFDHGSDHGRCCISGNWDRNPLF